MAQSGNILLITRPQPQADKEAAFFSAHDISTHTDPMLIYQSIEFSPPDLSETDALIITSAQALEKWLKLDKNFNITLYCVGEQTTSLAIEKGYKNARSAGGNAQDLCALIQKEMPKGSTFLYLRGKNISFDISATLKAQDYACSELITYKTVPAESFSAQTLQYLQDGKIAAISLYSAQSAQNFARIVCVNNLCNALKNIKLLCISNAVLEYVRTLGAEMLLVSEKPDGEAMRTLALKTLIQIK